MTATCWRVIPAGLKEQVAGEVQVELVWREAPPLHVPEVAALQTSCVEFGRRWTLRLAPEEARTVVATVTGGAAFAALDSSRWPPPAWRTCTWRWAAPCGGLVKASTRAA
ncbi:ABC transporter ATP-binding protein [Streptomyces tanashiensis]